MADRSVSVHLEAEIADYLAKMARASKATDKFGKDTQRSIGRAGSVAIKALGGVQAAAVASSAGVAAALGGASAAFIGLGAVALRNNEAVRDSFQDLSHTIDTGIAQDAAPLQDAFVSAADNIGDAYTRLRPQMRDAFEASVPHVETLTEAVTGFAENAMPGMVTAVERAGPVMEGLRSASEDAGAGVSEFFEIISRGSEDAGQGVEHFGSLVRGVLPETASLINDLSALWAEHGDEVADVITRLIGVIGDLTGSALPVLSTATGTALEVLSGVLDVIEPMTDALGPAIGAWISLASAMKAIRGVQGLVAGVSTSVADFGKSMNRADRRARSFKIGAAGLALGLASIAQSTGDARPEVDAISESLEGFNETGRASGEAARAFGAELDGLSEAVKQVTSNDLYRWVSEGLLGILPDALAPFQGYVKDVEDFDSALAKLVKDDNASAAFSALKRAAQNAGVPLQELIDELPKYRAALQGAKEDAEALGKAAGDSVPGAEQLKEAIKTLGNEAATTSDRVDALNTAWRETFGIQLDLKEATAQYLEGLASLRDTVSSTKEETNNWRSALIKSNGEVNLATEQGRELNEQLTTEGENYRELAQTAFDTALKQTGSQQRATEAARQAVQKRRAQFISEMKQLGFTAQEAQNLADDYLGMPEDVRTWIKQPGMAAARSNTRGLQDELNDLDGTNAYTKIFQSIITTRDTTGVSPGGPPLPFDPTGATGGLVSNGDIVPSFARGGVVHGPGGPTDDLVPARFANGGPARLSDGEFIVNARATRENLALLRAINSGRMSSGGTGGPNVGSMAGAGITVENLEVQALTDQFSMKQVEDELAMHGAA